MKNIKIFLNLLSWIGILLIVLSSLIFLTSAFMITAKINEFDFQYYNDIISILGVILYQFVSLTLLIIIIYLRKTYIHNK